MTNLPYRHILNAVFDQVWAILPAKLGAMIALLELRAAGLTLSDQDIRARIGTANDDRRDELEVTRGGIGVLPVFGVLAQRLGLMSAISGGTSTETLGADFRSLRDNPTVKGIVLAIDSPGGSCYGLDELATEIRASRGRKPVVAAIDSLAASGAYYLAAQADSVAITPGGDAGHIGVITAHQDLTGAQTQLGIKTTLITAGQYKSEGHPLAPLTEEGRVALQRRVDQAYTLFVRAVAGGRGVSEAVVRAGFGQGRLLCAEDARAAGLVDRIEPMEATIDRLEATIPNPSRAAVHAEHPVPTPTTRDTPQDLAATADRDTGQDRARDSWQELKFAEVESLLEFSPTATHTRPL